MFEIAQVRGNVARRNVDIDRIALLRGILADIALFGPRELQVPIGAALERDIALTLEGSQAFGKAQWSFFEEAVRRAKLQEPEGGMSLLTQRSSGRLC